MKNEIEATFSSIDKAATRERLRQAGFVVKTPEYMMRRKAFEVPSAPGEHKWGRVRQEADKITMAVKEVRGPGINDTYEAEVIVNNFEMAVKLFEACGMREKALQENLREVWKRDDVEVMIDTWPGLQPLLEVEGPDETAVRKTCDELGLSWEQALFGAVDAVYAKELGIPNDVINAMPEITFTHPPLPMHNNGS